MKILKNKFLVKLIATICLFLTLLNFLGSSKVYAAKDDEVWGGVLINPIVNLMTAIGDSIMEILHDSIQSQDAAIIKIDGHEDMWDIFATIVAAVVGIIAAIGFIVVVVGTGAAIGGALALLKTGAFVAKFSITLTTIVGAIGTGVVAGVAVKEGMIPDDIYLPAFSITAEEIFRNEILLFDVNFFDPMESQQVNGAVTSEQVGYHEALCVQFVKGTNLTNEILNSRIYDPELNTLISEEKSLIGENKENGKYYELRYALNDHFNGQTSLSINYIIDTFNDSINKDLIMPTLNEILERVDNALLGAGAPKIDRNSQLVSVNKFSIDNKSYSENDAIVIDIAENVTLDNGKVEPRLVRILIMQTKEADVSGTANTTTIHSTAKQLQGIISTWYFILRNVALLVLMLLLIYSGIRIVIGSTAGEKAKYKERLMDWLVAICLIFVMHYIMAFAVEIVERITDLVGYTSNGNKAYIQLTDKQEESAKIVLESFDTIGGGKGSIDYDGEASGEHGALVWPTDLAGLFRIQSQLTEEGTSKWVGYSLCYVVLVLFTLFFAFTYARRVLYMAFLTLIAPLVAMTYPIDKITDGKAQAFDAWLKEYIFNLMIQPLHLLLYTILVSSAYTLASESAIYALVAIGFMTPAEKLMRRFFGFEKAKTPGLLSGAAGTALAMTGLQKVFGGHKSHGGKNGGNSGKQEEQSKLKFARKNTINAMDTIAGENSTLTPKVDSVLDNSIGGGNNKKVPVRVTKGGTDGSNNKQPKQNIKKIKLANQSQLDNKRQQKLAEAARKQEEIWGETKRAREPYEKARLEAEKQKRIKEQEARTFTRVRAENDRIRREKALRAAKGAGTELARQVGVQALEGVQGLGGTAAKMLGGLPTATLAALASIPGGDINKLAQNTAIGYSLGASFTDSLSRDTGGIDIDAIEREAEMAAEGENYKNAVIEKENEDIKTSTSNINYLRQTMGISREQAKQIMNTTGDKCINNGIKDIEDIATIHKLTTGDQAMSFNQAVAAREYAKKRLPSDTDKMTEKSIKQHKERWTNEFKEKYTNLNNEQAAALADKSFNLAIRYNKAKSGLTKL